MTEQDETTELTEEQAEKVRILEKLKSDREKLQQQEDTLKGELRDELGEGKYTVDGQPAISVSATRTFDSETARENVPKELLPLILSESIDSAKARKILPPAMYDACRKESGKKQIRLS